MNKQWKYTNKDRGWTDQNRKPVTIDEHDLGLKEESIEYEESNDVRKKSKLKTPRPKNSETLISHVPTPGFDDVKIHHEPELRGGFKALAEKGIRITNYHEELPK